MADRAEWANPQTALDTSRYELAELYRLSHPRALVTRELHPFNAFYGHAELLRRYARLDGSSPIKAAIEHGPSLFDNVGDPDLPTRLPRYLCASPRQAAIFERHALHGAQAVAIGAPILYVRALAPPLATPTSRTLVFFAAHSTHFVTAHYDIDATAEWLESFREQFDEIVVCLYWRDVLLGSAEAYRRHGFRCVTAGHMFDARFLFRLLAIIASASVVLVHRLGTQALYSALLGRPVWIERAAVEYTFAPHVQRAAQMAPERFYEHAASLFSQRSDEVTAEQLQFVNDLCGPEAFRTPDALRAVLEEAEEAYRDETPTSWKCRLEAVTAARLVRNLAAQAALDLRRTARRSH
jgi:hypothetical protein